VAVPVAVAVLVLAVRIPLDSIASAPVYARPRDPTQTHVNPYELANAPDLDAYAYYARGGNESPELGHADAAARRAERFRRMSTPQPPVGSAPPHGGAHNAPAAQG
jgi:hypothetical protein